MRKNRLGSRLAAILLTLLVALSVLTGCSEEGMDLLLDIADSAVDEILSESEYETEDSGWTDAEEMPAPDVGRGDFDLSEIPPFTGEAYLAVNGNTPYFTQEDLTAESFEYYSPLDGMGRCGMTVASVGQDLMPTEERGSISHIKPTGWVQNRYDGLVDGGSLYNRCHLIGHQLTGEDANECNLITGTRYLNIEGMLPFENMVADYVKETGNHVLYRVTPVFDGDDLVAAGVLMEGYSVEDEGDGVCFCVFAYNAQPGIGIDYATGENWLDESGETAEDGAEEEHYIVNTNTGKFHKPSCGSVDTIEPDSREEFIGSRDELLRSGFEPCGRCKP